MEVFFEHLPIRTANEGRVAFFCYDFKKINNRRLPFPTDRGFVGLITEKKSPKAPVKDKKESRRTFFHSFLSLESSLPLHPLPGATWRSLLLLKPEASFCFSLAMDDSGGSKLSGIRQIVRLKGMIQKWQSVTLGSKVNSHGGISPIINRRLRNVMYCDSDEESCQSPEPPPDVPKGYLAVYVGPELRRFIIPTAYLSHSLFKVLLEKAADEFGFEQSGGLTIPCEIETFKYLLNCMENKHKDQHDGSPSGNAATIEE